ncbi:MAG: MBL fold metallo-hydrolase [Candidatus Omnitrophica bacterium]|nr:MBL fold metallo-hydrolase [Candidatus Omnitrophota bacterium]
MIDRIKWLGHASFLIEDKKIIYFDPWKLKKGLPLADIVLITHSHYDHCSNEDVNKIKKKQTIVITDKSSAQKLSGVNIKIVRPEEKINIDDIVIEVFAAYNINKPFHPQSLGGLGFVVEISGKRIYHCGDTDVIPEMEKISCDIALLAVSGTYVMTPSEAVKAVKRIKPKIVIPMHYGDIVGTEADAEEFVRLCKDIPVETMILQRL